MKASHCYTITGCIYVPYSYILLTSLGRANIMATVVVNIATNYIIFTSNYHKVKAIYKILDILNGTNS